MSDLQTLRAQIDAIDTQIRRLFLDRLLVADGVAEYKRERGLPVLVPEREKEKLAALTADLADQPFEAQGVAELFEQIMSTSRKRQYAQMARNGFVTQLGFSPASKERKNGLRVVYQGVPGAYSHAAAEQYFENRGCTFVPVPAWRDALRALEEDAADRAVLPLENSTAGVVYENYDLLMSNDVAITGEIRLPIAHALLGVPGAKKEDITVVRSHPQALLQCEEYLRRELPRARIEAVSNTAAAAAQVQKDGERHAAAIAGEINASLYGLDVLEREIQDAKGNETRFIVVSSEKVYSETAGQISICFSLPNEAGSLYRILSHFIFNGLNMTRIESRPLPGKPWEYLFFVDFEGNLQNEAVVNALLGIREEAKMLRVLGNY